MWVKSSGFSLVETLVSTGIISVTVLIIISTLSNRLEAQKMLNAKASLAQADALIDGIFKNPRLCDCQLNNPANPSLVVPVNTNGAALNVAELRTSCDPANASNLAARTGNEIIPGVAVNSIILKNISATGSPNQYTGTVEMTLNSALSKPLIWPVAFEIDPGNRRPIRCSTPVSPALGFTTCPAGFRMIGDPSAADNFCIENNQRAPSTYPAALLTCDSIRPSGFNTGRLCYTWELRRACADNVLTGPNNEEYSAEVTPDGAGNVHGVKIDIRTATDCAPNWTAGPTQLTPGAFRCCLK